MRLGARRKGIRMGCVPFLSEYSCNVVRCRDRSHGCAAAQDWSVGKAVDRHLGRVPLGERSPSQVWSVAERRIDGLQQSSQELRVFLPLLFF